MTKDIDSRHGSTSSTASCPAGVASRCGVSGRESLLFPPCQSLCFLGVFLSGFIEIWGGRGAVKLGQPPFLTLPPVLCRLPIGRRSAHGGGERTWVRIRIFVGLLFWILILTRGK